MISIPGFTLPQNPTMRDIRKAFAAIIVGIGCGNARG
jgi:hypothetical protein